MLVAMGAALFTVSSIQLSEVYLSWNGSIRFDPSRIISTIVSGIGFLGGAIIFKTEERVRGVTTAASIWVVTGVGVATGAGFYVMAAGSTVLIVVVLLVVGWIEHRVGFKKGPVLPEVEDD
jgi:putative Mg2+ transporter-C (MgtC) family protein